MFHAQSQPLSAPMRSPQVSGVPAFPMIDRATAQALRRMTTPAGVCDERHGCRSLPASSLFCDPTIRTLPATSESESVPVPVVLVLRQELATTAPIVHPERSLSRLRADLSWMIALLVALSVTLALAIPLELFRQNG